MKTLLVAIVLVASSTVSLSWGMTIDEAYQSIPHKRTPYNTQESALSKAILVRRDLSGAHLNRASLTAAKLVETIFGNTQLNKVSGLECRCFTLGTPIHKIGRTSLISRRPLKFPERG